MFFKMLDSVREEIRGDGPMHAKSDVGHAEVLYVLVCPLPESASSMLQRKKKRLVWNEEHGWKGTSKTYSMS